ncbi:hypothetical protein Fmac_001601 [Flemingia macrophylla]|uniref:Uncharacterized protein n=1 Tax=Flemingia macrophylla TaxID=520843 RepID=A0ABD1NHQ6_9FABA
MEFGPALKEGSSGFQENQVAPKLHLRLSLLFYNVSAFYFILNTNIVSKLYSAAGIAQWI